MFKIRNGYTLYLQTPETIKLFGSRKNKRKTKTKTKAKKKKKMEKIYPSTFELVLVQINLLDYYL